MNKRLDVAQLEKTGVFTTLRKDKDYIIIGNYTFVEERRTVASIKARISKLELSHKDIDKEIEKLKNELEG